MNRPTLPATGRPGARALTIEVPAHQFEALCQLVDTFWRSRHGVNAEPVDAAAATQRSAQALACLVEFAMTGRGERARVVARVLVSLFSGERCLVDLRMLHRLDSEHLAHVMQLLSRQSTPFRDELRAYTEQLRALRDWVEIDDA